MKKIISLFILIFILSTVSSQAQDKDKKQKIGIRGGWQLSSMVVDGNKPDTAQYLNSFYIGLFRDNKMASILYFGTGIEYFQNGLKYSNNTKRVVHTISIPLNLKLKLGPVFILGGAAANIKVTEKIIIGDDKYDPVDGNRTEWFDVAAFAGAGVKIFFLTVEARYHWGLLDVRNDLKNRYFQLGLGVSF